ncbi:hypothetical protein [Pyxidicoccus xibeiensis]|uniref:hypothetical protein n=1 Tax=Pyxidicoccus xibeiensis TaxID=2906759 RepID=UPI0020A6E0FD|nr:hypothetical protein [Pyxidicoccus xibeiensis]MCP3136320.1 hypothetical protein [Pyxidicoccus xibeiensis]
MSEPSYEFGVVCEARADQLTACGIADRVLAAEVDWLVPEVRDTIYRWTGVNALPEDRFIRWQKVREELAQRGIKSLFGFFGGESGRPDAFIARQALLLFASLERRPDAVLLVRDSDGDPTRREGLEQARSTHPWPFQVVIALAEPKREAWVLAGFEPANADEMARLRSLRERLSMDPVLKSHELDASEHGAKKDIKRALYELIQDDWDRERQCLDGTPLEVLEQRGRHNGLAAFMAEVRERLVPILKGTGRTG